MIRKLEESERYVIYGIAVDIGQQFLLYERQTTDTYYPEHYLGLLI